MDVALGWFYRWCLRGVRAGVEEGCLHRYQVARGTEGEGARGQNRPLLQNEKQWVRKMLSAAVSQMDSNRAGMLEKVLRWLSLTPMTDTSRHRLGSGISRDSGHLRRPCE